MIQCSNGTRHLSPPPPPYLSLSLSLSTYRIRRQFAGTTPADRRTPERSDAFFFFFVFVRTVAYLLAAQSGAEWSVGCGSSGRSFFNNWTSKKSEILIERFIKNFVHINIPLNKFRRYVTINKLPVIGQSLHFQ